MKKDNILNKITIILIALMSLVALNGCSRYLYKSKPVKITHVLSITETGDTLKIPIGAIRPNVIYNTWPSYNCNRPYYSRLSYRPYNYYNYIGGYRGNVTTSPIRVKVKSPTNVNAPKVNNTPIKRGGRKNKN